MLIPEHRSCSGTAASRFYESLFAAVKHGSVLSQLSQEEANMKLKNRIKGFMQDENGAMVATEALFLYPFTILVIFTMIYISLYMYQAVALQSFAQKIAVVAAREVAYPGYINMSTGGSDSGAVAVFGTNAIDWETTGNISMNSDAGSVTIHPYRYLTTIGSDSPILDKDQRDRLEAAAAQMVKDNSILVGNLEDGVTVTASNWFVSQSVEVTISQSFPVLGFVQALGFEGNTITAKATASANDPDEFVRNVDLVFYVADGIAKKLGINTTKVSEMIQKCKDALSKFNVTVGGKFI